MDEKLDIPHMNIKFTEVFSKKIFFKPKKPKYGNALYDLNNNMEIIEILDNENIIVAINHEYMHHVLYNFIDEYTTFQYDCIRLMIDCEYHRGDDLCG